MTLAALTSDLRNSSCSVHSRRSVVSMKWSYRPAREHFEAARGDWDALNRSQHDHILLDSGFVAPLLRYFGNGRVLLGVSANATRPGMALVVRKALGIWETF